MSNKAVKLTLAAVAVFLAAVLAMAITMPWLANWYQRSRNLGESGRIAILVTFYACFPFALTALLCMWKLLRNIAREQVFVDANSRLLAIISWCCAAVAAVALGTFRWYMPMIFIPVSMAFIFLIVRVVRNCFIAAIALKEENSLTI